MSRAAALRHPWRGRTRSERLLLGIGSLLLGLLVVGLLWVLVTGLIARSELQDMRSHLKQLRHAVLDGDLERARSLEHDIKDEAASAHELTSGPAWWVAANVPALGSPFRTGRTIAVQADQLGTHVVPGILELVNTIRNVASPADSTLDLRPIERAAPVLLEATRSTRSAAAAIDSTEGSWLPFVRSSRAAFSTELHKLVDNLSGADRAIRVALPMLGASGPQRIFVGFLNEAESRGLGGIPGAFAIMVVNHGRITFEKFGSDDDLRGVRAEVNLGAEYRSRYRAADPTGVIQNSDISPDFRDAARIWAGMWKAKTGQTVNGAIALDPTALSYLLDATGSARLADGSRLTARNVVKLTQQKQYSLFPSFSAAGQRERKAYLIDIARTVAKRFTSGVGQTSKLIANASRAAQHRRLLVWNADPALERDLIDARWAGVLGPRSAKGPYSGFVVSNAAASKLDYYLKRTMVYRRSGCETGASAVATFTLTNGAPARGLPKYVTIRGDKPARGYRPGDNKLIVTYYATAGSQIQAVTVDGKARILAPGTERGLLAVTLPIELPVGRSRSIRITTLEPRVVAPVEILRQPLVQDMRLRQSGPRCGPG